MTGPRADLAREATRVDLAGESPHGFLSDGLIDRLLSVFENDIPTTALVVENPRGVFCTGLDPSLLIAGDDATRAGVYARAALERFDRLLQALEGAPCPVIAVVDGAAMGGGVALAAAADLVIATGRASFGLPETLIGIVPALAFPVLARRIGTTRARWMALSGTTIDAAEAVRLGLADVIADEPETTLAPCLRRLARLDARSIAAVKRLAVVHRAEPKAYHAAALQTFGRLLESPETQARLRRFAAGFAPWPEDEQG